MSAATAKSIVGRNIKLVNPCLKLVASDLCVKAGDGHDFRISESKGRNSIKSLELVGAACMSKPLSIAYLSGVHGGHGPGRASVKADRLRYIREVFKDGLYSDGQRIMDCPQYSTGGSVEI